MASAGRGVLRVRSLALRVCLRGCGLQTGRPDTDFTPAPQNVATEGLRYRLVDAKGQARPPLVCSSECTAAPEGRDQGPP